MQPRLAYGKVAPDVQKIMYEFYERIGKLGLPEKLLMLVYLRASQINGCAYCIDMHSKDLRAHGETEQRVYMLDAWRESPFYSSKERAALAWTEAVTKLQNQEVPDAVYEQAKAEFSEAELARLTLAIVEINCWNRLNIAFRTVPGSYKPRVQVSAAATVSA
ncbi:MAG: carboxymuconolactone decarboxylase family protein [Hyphomicrobiales bacterium]